MTTETQKPPETPSPQPAKTPSVEERLSAMERELESNKRANARLQSERDSLRNQIRERESTIRSLREDAELAGLDDEGEKARRREIVRRERELEEAREQVKKREEELNSVAGELLAERYASLYGVPKEELLQYTSESEMRAAAADMAWKKAKEAPAPKQEAPPPPPPPKQESGESLSPRKRVQDMTDAEFKDHYQKTTGRTFPS